MSKMVAHRGYSGKYPENTMLAFQKAVEAGCDGIELDVQISKDGEVVIIHDEKIDRVSNGTGLVRDYTVKELQAFDAYGAFEGKFEKQKIPTLSEYFAYMQDKPQFTNIELKNGIYVYPGLEEKTIALINKFHMEGKVQFSSFNHYSMVKCKKLAPFISTGLLVECWIVHAGAYGKSVQADYINGRYECFTEETVPEIRQHGLGYNAWTVNDKEEMGRLIRLQADSIITNYPDMLK